MLVIRVLREIQECLVRIHRNNRHQEQQGQKMLTVTLFLICHGHSVLVTTSHIFLQFLNRTTIQQAVSFQGSVTITKKMSATFQSGYDFNANKITMTNIGITRDLHCWDMSLNWVPNGNLQSWNFLIKVKAAVLGDLKYERRKDFHDSY